jgi:hypothetical protein
MTKWAGWVMLENGTPQRFLVDADNVLAAEAMLSAYGRYQPGSAVHAAEWEQNRSSQSSGGSAGTIPNALVIAAVLIWAFLKWLGLV